MCTGACIIPKLFQLMILILIGRFSKHVAYCALNIATQVAHKVRS